MNSEFTIQNPDLWTLNYEFVSHTSETRLMTYELCIHTSYLCIHNSEFWFMGNQRCWILRKTYFLSWSGPGMEIWGSQTIYGQIFSVRSFLEGSRELGIAWTNKICLQFETWVRGSEIDRKSQILKVLRMSLPISGNVPTSAGSVLRAFPASHGPYGEKNENPDFWEIN